MKQLELFPDFEFKEDERLYVIGNGFDIHHMIDSKYVDFKKWVQQTRDAHLVRMMDTFFSNDCDFWADIENALGVVEQTTRHNMDDVNTFFDHLEEIFAKDDFTKAQVVDAIKEFIPNFEHEEKGKNLDQKM